MEIVFDSPTKSLKAVLLNKGNELGSITISYSVNMTETYDNMKMVLDKIGYSQHNWKICGDLMVNIIKFVNSILKMITMHLEMQGCCTKHACFICLWDSRADTVIIRKMYCSYSRKHGS